MRTKVEVMSSYAYSASLWPAVVSATLLATLAWYCWRHRRVPAALPLAIACLFGVAWSLSSLLETAALDPATKIVWLKLVTIWQLPLVTAATCFVLEYAGLGRWLTRRNLVLLAVPPLLSAALMLTDGLHHLAWNSFSLVNGNVQPELGPGLSAALAYSFLLSTLNLGVLVWLFARSPRHRWPVALMVLAQIGARVLFGLGVLGWRLPPRWDPDPFVLVTLAGLYAVALFGFHVFDPVPAARRAVLAQMLEGMIVLDAEGRIVDVNVSAERMLGEHAAGLRGRRAEEVLPFQAGSVRLSGDAPDDEGAELFSSDLELGTGASARSYALEATSLTDRHGSLGRLLLLHDVTERKRAEARALEQERVVATLQERERLARELHDGVGQVLGYVSLQAQTARKRLLERDDERAEALLARLTDVAQRAHADVRESILALKAGSSVDWSFLPALARYLEDFRDQYGIQARLDIADGVTDESFSPGSGVQLLRVIQEAMTNARRHAGRSCTISVSIERRDGEVRIAVSDDGCGFEPEALQDGSSGHFGLAFMRERMTLIAGTVAIASSPGEGTRVALQVPLLAEREARR